jgi:hypothetical protein
MVDGRFWMWWWEVEIRSSQSLEFWVGCGAALACPPVIYQVLCVRAGLWYYGMSVERMCRCDLALVFCRQEGDQNESVSLKLQLRPFCYGSSYTQ